MKIKLGFLVMAFLLVIANGYASVIINEVYPNPILSEYDGEFIELYNPENESVDMGNWTIEGPTGIKIIIPSGTSINAGRYLLIADAGFKTGKDNSEWSDADIEQEMTLKNTDETLMLKNGSSLIDMVGWGNATAEGSPSKSPLEGKSLSRVNFSDTSDNANDFYMGDPTPTNSTIINDDDLHVVLTINNAPPVFEMVEILKDDSGSEGIQILPSLEGETLVPVSLLLSDSNGGNDLFAVGGIFNNTEFNLTLENTTGLYASYHGNFSIPMKFSFGTYDITFFAEDSKKAGANITISIEILPLIAIKLTNALLQFGSLDPGTYSPEVPVTIENIGNVPIRPGLSGTPLSGGSTYLPPDNILYKSYENWFNLSSETSFLQESVPVSMQQSILFKLFVPWGYQAETYEGKIVLTVIAA